MMKSESMLQLECAPKLVKIVIYSLALLSFIPVDSFVVWSVIQLPKVSRLLAKAHRYTLYPCM